MNPNGQQLFQRKGASIMRALIVCVLFSFFNVAVWAQNAAYIRCKGLKEVSATDKNFELVSLQCGEKVTVLGLVQDKFKIQRVNGAEVLVNPFFLTTDSAVMKADQLGMDMEKLDARINELQKQLQGLQAQKAQMEKQIKELASGVTAPGASSAPK
jgi:TolA-binding protein